MLTDRAFSPRSPSLSRTCRRLSVHSTLTSALCAHVANKCLKYFLATLPVLRPLAGCGCPSTAAAAVSLPGKCSGTCQGNTVYASSLVPKANLKKTKKQKQICCNKSQTKPEISHLVQNKSVGCCSLWDIGHLLQSYICTEF